MYAQCHSYELYKKLTISVYLLILIIISIIYLTHNYKEEENDLAISWLILHIIFWFLGEIFYISGLINDYHFDIILILYYLICDAGNSLLYFATNMSTDEIRNYVLVIMILQYIETFIYIIGSILQKNNIIIVSPVTI